MDGMTAAAGIAEGIGGLTAAGSVAGLYRDHHGLLVQYLRRRARCPALAEDLAQQLWLRMLELLERGGLLPSDPPGLRAFLLRSARNLFIDECLRRRAATRQSLHEPHELERLLAEHGQPEPGPEEQVATEQLRAGIARALDALPVEQREVVSLWMAGASIEAMAQATRAPRDTVLSRKKYGLRKLRSALQPDVMALR